jgi:hypothetical protein
VYFDNDEISEPEIVGLLTTDGSGKASLTERTKGRTEALGRGLEAGTYYIKEIKASPGYVVDKMILNGDKTEEIKEGKIEVLCGYSADGKPQTKTVKGIFEDGKHLFKARVQSEGTSVFTYTITSKESPHHSVIHKTDITTGEEIPGANLQVINSDGEIVDEWKSGETPHDIIALPDGKYKLREITAPYGYDIAEDVVFEVRDSVIKNEVVMHNKPLKIGTIATNAETSSHHGTFSEEEIIKDQVEVSGLYEGRSYKVSGCVMDKASGQAILDKDGNPVTAESEEFIAKADTVKVELSFAIDSSEFKEESAVVVFEKLYRTSRVYDEDVPVEIAKHEDIDDESQSIHYGGIAKTVAADKKDGDKELKANRKAVVIDTVEYSNLSPEETYFVTGTLYDKTTGELTDIKGSREFTPTEANGTVPVEFKFDAAKYENHSLVVFEYLFNEGGMISKHDEIDNKDQTVHFVAAGKSPNTGDMNYLILFTIITTIAMVALALMIHHRNKNRDL